MLSVVIMLASCLASFTAAQNSNSSALNIPSSVPQPMKNEWCLAQRNACPRLCGGSSFVENNDCIASKIEDYVCTCSNGSPPENISQYVGTVPNFVCVYEFAECRKATPGSNSCKECGTLNPLDVKAAVVTSTAASSSTEAPTAASETAAAATTAVPTGAAPKMAAEVGGLAVGAVAAWAWLL